MLFAQFEAAHLRSCSAARPGLPPQRPQSRSSNRQLTQNALFCAVSSAAFIGAAALPRRKRQLQTTTEETTCCFFASARRALARLRRPRCGRRFARPAPASGAGSPAGASWCVRAAGCVRRPRLCVASAGGSRAGVWAAVGRPRRLASAGRGVRARGRPSPALRFSAASRAGGFFPGGLAVCCADVLAVSGC